MASLLGDLLQLGVHPRAVAGWPEVASPGKPIQDAPPDVPPWRVEVPRAGRAVVDERLGRVPRRQKRRGRRRAI
jgi:hypothetical protein